jgi:hypothetical protein
VDAIALEAAMRQLAPDAIHVEVLQFKSPGQAAKYPPGSKVSKHIQRGLHLQYTEN